MKTGYCTILIISLTIVIHTRVAQGTNGIDNPAGITTVPQSSINDGTYRNPVSDYYNYQPAGNLIVTGNVTGGSYFRGLVPYQSTQEISLALPSSSLDSFLRDSARTYYPDVPIGVAQPHYLPSRMVTTLGGYELSSLALYQNQLNEQTIRQFNEAAITVTEDRLQIPPQQTPRTRRPMSIGLSELEELMSFSIPQPQTNVEPVTSTIENQMAELAGQLHRQISGTNEFQQDFRDKSLEPPSLETQDHITDQPEKPAEQTKPDEEQKTEQKQPVDIYRQMEQQIEREFQERLEQLKAEAEAGEAEKEQEQQPQAEGIDSRIDRKASRSDHRRRLIYEHFLKDKSAESTELSWQNMIAKELFLKQRGRQSTGGVQPGTYKSFKELTEARFNQYLQVAGEYMKQGEYYRAADAWTLASTYKPDDPVAYAGKAYALFAVGEYMSSAFYLSRAIEMYPGYLQLELNLEAIIADKDTLDKRIADLTKWARISGSGELFFLLSYVSYRINNLELAQDAIEITLERMPDSAAVITLKNVIFKALGRSQ
jgi:tetratricopeptide (TPR) repeat protein